MAGMLRHNCGKEASAVNPYIILADKRGWCVMAELAGLILVTILAIFLVRELRNNKK